LVRPNASENRSNADEEGIEKILTAIAKKLRSRIEEAPGKTGWIYDSSR
jgi:hypothetical protein